MGWCSMYIFLVLFYFDILPATNITLIQQPDHFLADNASFENWGTLHSSSGVYSDSTCRLSFEEIRRAWQSGSLPVDTLTGKYLINGSCHWSRIRFANPSTSDQVHYIHFYKSWISLTAWVQASDGSYSRQQIGLKHGQEILPVRVPAEDTLLMYVRYPDSGAAFIPTPEIREITEAHYLSLDQRTSLKYLLFGFLGFPVCFFLIVYILERDKIILAYLLFLAGAALNMLSILDTTPYFDYTPKFVNSLGVIQPLFVLGGLLSLSALIKYIHYLLEVRQWSPLLHKSGQAFILLFLLVSLFPFVNADLFFGEKYGDYLQYYRVTAFLNILYLIWLCIAAVSRRISFSRVLLLAFAPFLVCTLYYAVRFILIGEYSSTSIASLILIGGFYMTILLFGIILGIRNNLVKAEKLRLEQETSHLKELDAFKSRFYTNFTHEFRTPLTVINGMAEQIEGHEREKSMIRRNARRLLQTVNDLLDLSKLESDHMKIDWVHGDVVPFLNYLTESCTSLAQAKRINLAFFPETSPIALDYDETKLQQILLNLLSNAIKFTPEYGSVKVIAGKISKAGKPFLKLSVIDTGEGIPEKDQPHIFDRFYQSGDTPKAEGTGIGLALVRELTTLLGGSIALTSSSDKGSTFVVTLPIHNQAVKKPAAHRPDPVPHDQSRDKLSVTGREEHPLVLLIEDNADVAEYIISCINARYNVMHARNGKAGTDLALEHIPDVIVSDVMMPQRNGFEVCEILKQDVRTSHIPIILLTAKASEEDRLTGLGHGADAYLTKPFNKEELLIRLSNMTAWSHRLREHLQSPERQSFENVIEKTEAAFLEKVEIVVDACMGNEVFDTDQLCRELAMSRTQLHRKLKALTGYSTAALIRKRRLSQAHHLLLSTDMPIGEIADRVGFKDFSHFSRSFAREYGQAPSELRTA